MKPSPITLCACIVVATPAALAAVGQDNLNDANRQVRQSVDIVNQMQRDPQLAQLLKNSSGVFIVPRYGRGAAVVGAQGGAGVVLAHRDGKWSDPAFFNMGGISVGAQVGGAGGSIAMIMTNDKALNMFENQANNFSLNANADLTVIKYSGDAQASAGKGDVVLWSDTKGAFVGASIGVSDIKRDQAENTAFYGRQLTPKQILGGQVNEQKAGSLRQALASP